MKCRLNLKIFCYYFGSKVGITGSYTDEISRMNQDYWNDFMSGAVINLSLNWLHRGMKESPGYMGKLIASFISHENVID
ncbi:TetR-like C-terminal domain-containing protein [Lentilactobacillus sp. SPB1-3]|uniref:TetR-like C-terminal domain-containing protein n=1 Tax=Lentilactobacillus terminaliae TaxID=3003483 RepID=A0ACD5DCV7_9LACO|nr:TetR-like C-terminal domain-containing protein [Lentilactobacillus sp. SPB1-3]MCZ0977346.1 TetR-like C-terminal domain-containing protein [Lentilactobacillus sp. SPB1-3]